MNRRYNMSGYAGEIRICEECGERALRVQEEEEEFPYGSGEERVFLRAKVPVWTCHACGEQHTDSAAEDLRHEAVCRHLGRMTPSALRAIREGHGYTQEEWARLTGYGLASIKRWETSAVVQNESADRYLSLLLEPGTVSRLRLRGSMPTGGKRAPHFRTQFTADIQQAAKRFELRPHPGTKVA